MNERSKLFCETSFVASIHAFHVTKFHIEGILVRLKMQLTREEAESISFCNCFCLSLSLSLALSVSVSLCLSLSLCLPLSLSFSHKYHNVTFYVVQAHPRSLHGGEQTLLPGWTGSCNTGSCLLPPLQNCAICQMKELRPSFGQLADDRPPNCATP